LASIDLSGGQASNPPARSVARQRCPSRMPMADSPTC